MDARAVSGLATLTGAATVRQDIRKSVFEARADTVATVDAALAHIRRASDHGATHNCWAYRVGSEYRFNDDGEPGGSAGRPILLAIDGQGLDRVAVVVTRWFGGVKLGVGGLVRAYGGCAAECLRLAGRHTLVERVRVTLQCDYAAAAQLRVRWRDFEVEKESEVALDGAIGFTLALPQPLFAAFAVFVRDLTRGRAQIHVLP